MARLLVGQRMQHGIAELDELIGRDRIEAYARQGLSDVVGATAQPDLDGAPDVIVEYFLQREELRHRLAIDGFQDVTGRKLAVCLASGLHLGHHQHARQVREGQAHPLLHDLVQPQAPKFIVGRVVECRLQGAARHRRIAFDEFQRAHHCGQRQVETSRSTRGAARVQGDHSPLYIDDRRARRSARRARGRLEIERVEVVVLAVAVRGCLPVQARQGARKYRELLACVIADDPDLAPNDGSFRVQGQRYRFDEPQLRRVIPVDAEVMNGIAVYRPQLHFFAILEYGLGRDRARRDHVPIRQDQAALGINDKPGRLSGRIPLGIEGARRINLYRDDAARNARERLGPGGGLDGAGRGLGRIGRASRHEQKAPGGNVTRHGIHRN